jgi:hypothetical protein
MSNAVDRTEEAGARFDLPTLAVALPLLSPLPPTLQGVDGSAYALVRDALNKTAEEVPPKDYPRLRGAVAELIRGCVRWHPLGKVMPSLLDDQDAVDVRSPRLRNVLAREGVTTWAELATFACEEILDWTNVGEGLLHELLEISVDHVLQGAAGSVAPPRRGDGSGGRHEGASAGGGPDTGRDAPSAIDGTAGTLLTLVAWAGAELGADSVREAFELVHPDPGGYPEEVGRAKDLLEASPRELIPERLARFDPRRAAIELLEGLTELERQIVTARTLVLREGLSLGRLSRELGIARDRVWRFEHEAAARMRAVAPAPLKREAGRIYSLLGTMAPAVALRDAGICAESDIQPESDTAVLTAVWLAGPYTLDEGWLVLEPAEASSRSVQAALEGFLTREGPAPASALAETLSAAGVARAHQARWLRERARNIRRFGDDLVVWGGTRSDRAEQVLLAARRPMAPEEIAASFDDGTAPRAIANTLRSDARFVRTTKTSFSLALWGDRPFTSVADTIAEEIVANGGSVALEELLGDLPDRLEVRRGTIEAVARGARFDLSEDGFLTTASVVSRVGADPPELTARCYRTEEGWAFRAEIGAETLRGSGSTFPATLADLAGLLPDQSAEIPSDPAAVRIGINQLRQGYLGSVRPFVEREGGELGDHLFIELIASGPTARLHLRRRREIEAAEGPARCVLLAMPDADAWSARPLAGLVRALHLEPERATWAGVRERLRVRGEPDLLALVDDAPEDEEPIDAVIEARTPLPDADVVDQLAAIFGGSGKKGHGRRTPGDETPASAR